MLKTTNHHLLKSHVALVISVFLTGCANQPKTRPDAPEIASSGYTFKLKNNSGQAIQGATIFARYIDLAEINTTDPDAASQLPQKTHEIYCKTNAEGVCNISIPVKLAEHNYTDYKYLIPPGSSVWCINDCQKFSLDNGTIKDIFSKRIEGKEDRSAAIGDKIWAPAQMSIWGYATYASYSAYGGGLFGLIASHDVDFKKYPRDAGSQITLQGASVQEYFCDKLHLQDNKLLAAGLVQWSNELGGSLASARAEIPKRAGLCVTGFKDRDYVAITLATKIRYNSAKLNDYGIGVKIFDEVVREMLNPLGSAAKSLNLYGYDVKVKTYKENFATPDSSIESKSLEYRFIIPKDIAEQYKNKDLTGQQVIDKSYVLLNDERIDLRLQ